jgi:hypothetical protein
VSGIPFAYDLDQGIALLDDIARRSNKNSNNVCWLNQFHLQKWISAEADTMVTSTAIIIRSGVDSTSMDSALRRELLRPLTRRPGLVLRTPLSDVIFIC